MSDINVTLVNSVKKIERDVAEMRQMLLKLQAQFSNQFSPVVTRDQVEAMQQSLMEQTALDRIAESVKRSQVTAYPNQLGARVINSGDIKGKGESERYNALLQLLHKQDWTEHCKDIPEGQPLPQLVPLTSEELVSRRLQLKGIARALKHELIDKDYPATTKQWKDIPAADREYYMMRLERCAKESGFNIYKCKRMWCAKSLLRQSFKSDKQTHKRRMKEMEETNQDASSLLSFNGEVSTVSNGSQSPIMTDVLSPPPEATVKPPRKSRSRKH